MGKTIIIFHHRVIVKSNRKYLLQLLLSLQSCPTLWDPRDGSPPGSPVPGILQARPLEWVAISFSSAWKWKVKVKSLSCVWLLATPWTAAYQASSVRGIFQARALEWSAIAFSFIDYAKAFDCVDHSKLWKILEEMEILTTWPASWEICMQVRKQQLELDMEQQTDSK